MQTFRTLMQVALLFVTVSVFTSPAHDVAAGGSDEDFAIHLWSDSTYVEGDSVDLFFE